MRNRLVTGMRLTGVAALALLVSPSSLAQRPVGSDSTLLAIQQLYETGSYLNAELEARRYLEGRRLPDSMTVVAEQLIAFSLVAQGKPAAAAGHFAVILALDSSYALDPVLTSPKIRQAFEAAHQQSHASEWMMQGRPVPEGSASVPPPTIRLLLFPGWDQMYRGNGTKGVVLFSAGLLSLASGVTFDFLRRSARDDYLAATDPADVTSLYSRYDRYSKAEYYSFLAFLVVYAYSAFDALLDLPPRLEAAVNSAAPGRVISIRWTL